MRFAACNLLLMVALLGCDEHKAVLTPVRVVKPGSSVVRGKVTFGGQVPAPLVINAVGVCAGAGQIVDDTVIVDGQRGLANVIVHVDGVASSADGGTDRPILDQLNCMFMPHVLAVKKGQPVLIRNSDHELHNVHATPDENTAFNIGLAHVGDNKEVRFDKAEIFRVRCDVHPWMKAYIGVFDSNYFAVSSLDGSFEIKGLPPGSYELVAWHERFGELKQTIEVKDGTTEANFAYEPPK